MYKCKSECCYNCIVFYICSEYCILSTFVRNTTFCCKNVLEANLQGKASLGTADTPAICCELRLNTMMMMMLVLCIIIIIIIVIIIIIIIIKMFTMISSSVDSYVVHWRARGQQTWETRTILVPPVDRPTTEKV